MTDISTTGDCSSRLQDSERYAQILVEALELAMDQRNVAAARVGVLEGALRDLLAICPREDPEGRLWVEVAAARAALAGEQSHSLAEVREVVRRLQWQEFLEWPNPKFWEEWEGLLDLLGMERMAAPALTTTATAPQSLPSPDPAVLAGGEAAAETDDAPADMGEWIRREAARLGGEAGKEKP